nr:aromatic amino acid lyase [Komagataeibacter kakiaceti]
MSENIVLHPGQLDLATLRRFVFEATDVTLSPDALDTLAVAARSVERIVAGGAAVYGVNTGFGKLAKTRIPDDRLRDLQRNLVLSHAAGIGRPLPGRVVRLIMLLKANGLGRGFSGVRPEVVQLLLDMLAKDLIPVIPEKGSVGASGDLAPLAHMTAVLIGEARPFSGASACPARRRCARPVLSRSSLAPRKGWRCSTARRFPRPLR